MEPFKNIYNKKSITFIAKEVHKVNSKFNQKEFIADCLKNIKQLEMKERVVQIAEAFNKHLGFDYKKNLSILLKTIHSKDKSGVEGFLLWPYSYYIETYGINDFEPSMKALYKLTKKFTAEFGIRAFINKYPDKSYALLNKWTTDENQHVRRLVSEGTRPNLPWGQNIVNIQLLHNIELLKILKLDPALYVRKSVANHLNDISRIDPKLILPLLKQWNKSKNINLHWIVKHALRSLIKQGHPEALKILGFNPKTQVKVNKLKLNKKTVKEGDSLTLSFEIQNLKKQSEDLMVDYIVYYKKSNDQHSPKVFKLKTVKLTSGSNIQVTKKISFKKVTTRKHYSGKHFLALQINGKEHKKLSFSLSL